MPTPGRSVLTKAQRGTGNLVLGTAYQLNQEKKYKQIKQGEFFYNCRCDFFRRDITPPNSINFRLEILFTMVPHPKRKLWMTV